MKTFVGRNALRRFGGPKPVLKIASNETGNLVFGNKRKKEQTAAVVMAFQPKCQHPP